ncbi:type II toxin-antitoxin system RelE/ParE family toxin [Fibrella aquatilis]|uniref:Type II toxin-antitoxin system RelE/ParE family toxin n=1 Tax=Fibrella aquatilis TaxID=2817059 RepID=A0A939G4V5_9BACT|nr:type II toxin-antitoxin system RelE/ParE family toxin [Fibrella aquatilis]MBO0932412.1 type II toxin-antitoxin system RelE/ParE family toxin [Fibrella aquatilis]
MAGDGLFSVLLTEGANEDKEAIIDWYEAIQPSLGQKWWSDYKRIEETIAKNPFYYAENLVFIRGARLAKFPYSIFYRIDELDQIVVVLGILHQRQDRNEILRRINLI